jgi:hypothetical protein
MRRLGITVLVLTLASVVAGCGSPAETDGGDAGADDRESLADFIPGMPSFDPADQAAAEAQYRQQEQQVQEAIRDCMAAEGFEYVPYTPSEDEFFSGPETEEEYAKEYGLGIAPDLLRQGEFDEAAMQEYEDANPNTAIVNAMDEAEQHEYYRVLYGDEPDIDFETATEEEIDAVYQDFQPDGCEPNAYEDVYAQDASEAFYQEFGQAMEENFTRLEADPRIVELEQQWSSCMSDQGYDFADQQDASVYILRKLEEVGAITDLEVDSEGMGWGYGSEAIEPGSAIEAAVHEIADEEIEIAVASLSCRDGFEEVYQEVYQDAEARFIEEHRAELEQFRDENSSPTVGP